MSDRELMKKDKRLSPSVSAKIGVEPDNQSMIGYIEEYLPGKGNVGLDPKPTTDPLDPLNFSRGMKWAVLGIVMWMYVAQFFQMAVNTPNMEIRYFLFTYITTTTVPSFALLQEQYAISYAQVNWTVAIPAFGLAIGPLFWSSLADIYGRRIVFIVGTAIALGATIWSAVAPTYGGYMTARFFQGWGVSPAATVGMAVVNEFVHPLHILCLQCVAGGY